MLFVENGGYFCHCHIRTYYSLNRRRMLARAFCRSSHLSKMIVCCDYSDVIRCFSSIPKTMKCVDITEFGAPEVIHF